MFYRMKLATFLLSACFAMSVVAAPVWKVTKGGEHIYIAGTIHVLSKKDYPLPNAFDAAYEQSEWLIFETNIAALSSLEFQQRLMKTLTYSDGTTFRDELNDDTVDALEEHLSRRGVPIDNLLSFKPSFLAITLSNIEFQLIGLTSEGVDKHFSNRAINDSKRVAWLESPGEQLAFMAGLGEGQENALIAYTLDDIDTLPDSVNELRTQWRQGDMQGLARSQLTEMVKDFPAVYDALLTQRNKKWLPQIEELFATPETEFVLVGALHLAGDHSVLKMLTDKGYQVEKFEGDKHGQ